MLAAKAPITAEPATGNDLACSVRPRICTLPTLPRRGGWVLWRVAIRASYLSIGQKELKPIAFLRISRTSDTSILSSGAPTGATSP